MDVPCELLLHPELLTNEQLSHVLLQRHLRIPNLQIMPREQLLELFHSFCVPYGQRRYRDSGRGNILNKSRHLNPEIKPKTLTRKLVRSSDDNRLKPPPDLLTGHMKRIKLDTTFREQTNTPVKKERLSTSIIREQIKAPVHNNFKRKMSVDATIPASGSPPTKKERKPITWP